MLLGPCHHPCRSLGQHLKIVLSCFAHDGEDPFDKLVRYILVEQIGHRVDEDFLGLLPFEGKVKTFRPESQIKPLFIGMSLDSSKPFGECFCVTMLTTWANFGTTRDRVPSCVGPFDA